MKKDGIEGGNSCAVTHPDDEPARYETSQTAKLILIAMK